ncbi:MAG: methionyl-tRNA formyltransferase [Eubacteriales bacterium]|nr:methionyl-tRNA formyltransferase [Eubacteriales bacterium]MDY4214326.1 methionyl-tRNA formyltransferase [Eubacteriales bacterium]
MKILFMGTPDFAVPCLDILVSNGFDVCGAVTQPDKPRGRGHKLTPPPVKEYAISKNIPVYQPQTLKDGEFEKVLDELKPQLIAVVAYGKILPEYILDFPEYGCVNVHGSVLPKYRGAAPIQWAIINGDKTTGVTTQYMKMGVDTGDIIFTDETEILPDETYGELYTRLSQSGAELLLKTVNAIKDGTAPRTEQDESEATHAPMLTKETGHINWTKSADEVLSLIRGTNPWPMSYAMYGDEMMKVFGVKKGSGFDAPPGKIRIVNKKLEISCGKDSVVVDEIQFKGGKRMTVASYLNGHDIDENIILK